MREIRLALSLIAMTCFSVRPSLAGPASGETAIDSGHRGVAIPQMAWQLETMKAGDYVDLLVSYDKQVPGTNEPEGISHSTESVRTTAIILQNIKILKIIPADKNSGVGAVELLVNPLEAEYAMWALAWAKSLSLAVRADGDHQMHPYQDATMQVDLLR